MTAQPPLLIAAQNGHLEVVRLLLDRGADPNRASTYNGATVLYLVLIKNHTKSAELLLAYGAKSQLHGQLQPLPDNFLESLTNPAATCHAQRMYPDRMETIGTKGANAQLDKLKELVTVTDVRKIPKLKAYQPGDGYEEYARHSAQHAFLQAKGGDLRDAGQQVALATYFNLMNYQETIGADLTQDILNYKDEVIAGDDQEAKDVTSISEVISIVQQGLLNYEAGSREK